MLVRFVLAKSTFTLERSQRKSFAHLRKNSHFARFYCRVRRLGEVAKRGLMRRDGWIGRVVRGVTSFVLGQAFSKAPEEARM